MDSEVKQALVTVLAIPLVETLHIKVLQKAINRLTRRNISFGDAYFALWAVRILTNELYTGTTSASRQAKERKKAVEVLTAEIERLQKKRESQKKDRSTPPDPTKVVSFEDLSRAAH